MFITSICNITKIEEHNRHTVGYTYDNNGNLDEVDIAAQPGAVDIDYTWDAENRLTAVAIHDGQGGVQNITYEYDAQGVRVSKTVEGVETKYLIDPMRPYAQVLEEYTGEGATRDVQTSYTYGNDLIGQDQDGTDYFYLEDIHSGVRQMTNSSGAVTDTYEYDAYGNLLAETGSTANNYLYRGEQIDPDVDLQYLRARYYDPATGRFVSTDPFEGYQELPISRHRYLYAYDNPIMNNDPSGLSPFSSDEFAVASVIFGILNNIASGVTFGGSAILNEILGDGKWLHWTGFSVNIGVSPGIVDSPFTIVYEGAWLTASTHHRGKRYFGNWLVLSSGLGLTVPGLPDFPSFTAGGFDAFSPTLFGPRSLALSGPVGTAGTALVAGPTGEDLDIPFIDKYPGWSKTLSLMGSGFLLAGEPTYGYDVISLLSSTGGWSIPLPSQKPVLENATPAD